MTPADGDWTSFDARPLGAWLVTGPSRASSDTPDSLGTFLFSARLAFRSQLLDFFVGQMLDSNEHIPHVADPNEFDQLDLDRGIVAVLRVLNYKNHEKRHNRRSRIDNELPRIGKPKDRPGDCPDHDQTVAMTNAKGRPAARAVTLAKSPKILEASPLAVLSALPLASVCFICKSFFRTDRQKLLPQVCQSEPSVSSQCFNLKLHQWFHEFALAIDERPFL